MNTLKSYIIGAMALVAAGTLTACQDHFDEPDMGEAPVATLEANTTLAEFKEMVWQTSDNYCEQVYTKEWYEAKKNGQEPTEAMKTDGTHIVVKGRVVSSDYAGNCFKYIVLQDGTASLNFSIDSYNLYLTYRRGQEILVDLTGMHAGKYRGLEQVGFPSYNSSINGNETSFMGPQIFRRHMQLNGFPTLAEIDTVTINSISELGVTPAELRKWQSQLIRINNVAFVPDDVPTLSEYHSSGVSHNIQDAEGNSIAIRTSGYANFWNMEVPEGRGDIVAILGYYATIGQSGAWQLTLLDAASLMNFGNPTVPSGSQGNPYTVAQAIALQANGDGGNGWVRGYIVGTVAPEVENVASSEDVEWSDNPILGNTMVIAPDPECRDVAQCLVVALPQNSALYAQSLLANPSNYKKQIDIRGSLQSVMGTFGLSNSGNTGDFKIEGQTEVTVPDGDGSQDSPYNVTQIIAKGADNSETGVWVKGYIVGSVPDKYWSGAEFGVSATSSETNLVLAPTADCNDINKCIPIQLPAAIRGALNLKANPGNLGRLISLKGNALKFFGVAGLKETSEYVFDGDTPTPPSPEAGLTLLGKAEAAETALKGWTIANTSVWTWKVYNEAGYLNGSAFGSTLSEDAYAISPVLNLAGNTTVSVSWDHAAKFQDAGLRTLNGFAVREEGASAWTMLSIPAWPAAGAWTWSNSGSIDLSAYAGKKIQVAFKYGAGCTDTWEIRDLKFVSDGTIVNEGAGSDTPVTPPTPPVTDDTKGNFNSFNNGEPKSTYGTYTNATGWTAENCAILSGYDGEGDGTNPRFAFIGSPSTLAPTLNGNSTKPGKLTSPTLAGGCGKLTFNYGFAFNETSDTKFTVSIKQGDKVVKSETVTVAKADWVKFKVYNFSMDVNVTGDFSIEIVNDCAGAQTTNKERVSIWNLTWTE
ncbi:MAG: choice-of-anchor J domain-containing protein [Muribaculaceae bacterium]|nr:choice-of-anchor J domain-containing protein [Muribaculaceae bacterium]